MMYRLLIVAALLVIAYLLIRRAYRDFLEGPKERSLIGKDQMVQDPVCRVYVPKGVAVAATIGGQEYFFCSPGCAETFQKRLSG
jgi:YHS domain-containing protein